MLASRSNRLPQNILNIAHKHKTSAASYFNSVVPWCSEITNRDNNNLNNDGSNQIICKRFIHMKVDRPSSFCVAPNLFLRCNMIYRLYGPHERRYGNVHSSAFFNNDLRYFSTTANPRSNDEPTLKSESGEQSTKVSKRREKARKLAQTGATKARKGGSKVRELLSKYGWYFGGTYFGIYLVSLSSFYTALDTGLLDPSAITTFLGGDLMGHGEEEVDAVKMVASLLEKWDLTRPYSVRVEQNPKLTQLGVAWLATKIIEPVRIAVAVYVTPKVANALGGKSVDKQNQNIHIDDKK